MVNWNIDFGSEAVQRMLQRASCRNFTDAQISDETLQKILQAGIRAASGGNLQPYSIIVVKDKEKNLELAELCGGQQFIGQAPVNLIFLLDFYKMKRIAALERAPFTSPKGFMPFLIGLEDVVCCAQSMETAAWQLGLGSVYIGTVNHVGQEIAKIYNLPKNTYPVLILTLGYPQDELKLRSRLPFELTVFEERYPDLSDQEIIEGFTAKYGDKLRSLPKEDQKRHEWLERFERALLSTYSLEETKEIMEEVKERGGLTTFQYIFGLHYHAQDMLVKGKRVIEMMKDQEIEPFASLFQD